MYLPDSFHMKDKGVIKNFMASYPFSTLVSKETNTISHLPLITNEQGLIEGHFARNNPHSADLEHPTPVIAIFQGPHAYISPTFYQAGKEAVPTWNYTAIHIHGIMRPLNDAHTLRNHLDRLSHTFESQKSPSWQLSDVSETFLDTLSHHIVGFTIEITHIDAKFKLGQNRSQQDIDGIVKGLAQSANPSDHIFSEFAQDYYHSRSVEK